MEGFQPSALINQCREGLDCHAPGKPNVLVEHTGRALRAGGQGKCQEKLPGRGNAQEESWRKNNSWAGQEAGDFRQKEQQWGRRIESKGIE